MLSLYLFGTMCIVLWLKFLWSQRKWYFLSRKLPVPPGYPLIGNAWIFWNRDTTFDKIKVFREKYRETFGFWLGSKFVVYLYGPEDFQKVLNSPECLDKGDSYKYVGNFMGDGIFMSAKEKWLRNRKLINPSFSHKVLLSFFPIFNEKLDVLLQKLATLTGKGDLTLGDLLMRCTIDISCKTTMGTDLNSQNMENQEICNAYGSAKYIAGLRIFSPWLQPNFLFRLSKWYKVQVHAKTVLRRFVYGLIETKWAEEAKVQTKEALDCSKEESIKKNENIFIDQALKLVQDKQFTMDDVCNESNIVVAAAFDTTALIITYLLQCLAMFPEHQEKVIEEVRTIFPNEDFEITYEDTKHMVYSELVINETLRLFPGVPLLTRRTNCDYVLKDNIVLPKNTEIILDVIAMQRDPTFWGPTANTFDPLRFCDSRKDFHPYLYLPFSKGPRNCIGWRYAMFSLKSFVAKIFRKYRFTTDQKLEDLKVRMDVTLVCINDPIIRVHKIM